MRVLALLILIPFFSLFSQRLWTPTGAFVERTYISSTQYKISWGNVMFKRTLPDIFSIGFYDNPKFAWENPENICLEAECDLDCWYAIILPMNEDDDYVFYRRPFAYDTINNYIAFPGDGDTLVTIEHIPTGKGRYLITWDRCGDQENYSCIQNVTFDLRRHEVNISWLACGSELHPEVYATERTINIPLDP